MRDPPRQAVRSRRAGRLFGAVLAVLGLWLVAAYLILPSYWHHHEHQPGLATKSMLTRTPQGIPGDPINVGLVGTQTEVLQAMGRAGWLPADAITLLSSFKIGASVALDRAYPAAPISTLVYEGNPQALAFEKAVGISAKRRHHVRFWLSLSKGAEGRPVWLGAASYDRGVGLSRYTGQITHHVGPDLDAERDLLLGTLADAKTLRTIYRVAGIGPTATGRNGGGDPYFTDGDVTIGVLAAGDAPSTSTPRTLPDPTPVAVKNDIWSIVTHTAQRLHLVSTNHAADQDMPAPNAKSSAALRVE